MISDLFQNNYFISRVTTVLLADEPVNGPYSRPVHSPYVAPVHVCSQSTLIKTCCRLYCNKAQMYTGQVGN